MLSYVNQYPVAVQTIIILITCLAGWYFSIIIGKYFEKGIEKARFPQRILLKPTQFTHITMLILAFINLWFFFILFTKLGFPAKVLHGAMNVMFVVLTIYYAFSFISSVFWSRFIIFLCLSVIVLRVLELWTPFIQLLENMSAHVGNLRVSILGISKACVTFTVLWFASTLANRFFGFLLSTTTHMHHSDQLLIERAVRTATTVIIVLITLAAAGIDTAALAVAGGAIGFAIGAGLKEIGSNLICGIALLMRKPVSQGNVILLERPDSGGAYQGVIEAFGLIYVRIKTRDNTIELIPNEKFISHKIVNLSYNNASIRLHIHFGVSYDSDVKKAMSLAESAALTVERVWNYPTPACHVKAFGDSAVEIELRLWIKDPENGIGQLKGIVLLAIYDSFNENDIKIPFPQRDLHIKSAEALPVDWK